jgi:hypothetical protein
MTSEKSEDPAVPAIGLACPDCFTGPMSRPHSADPTGGPLLFAPLGSVGNRRNPVAPPVGQHV